MKHFKLTFLLTMLMSLVGGKVYAYDIAVSNGDGVLIYYLRSGSSLTVTYEGNSSVTAYSTYRGNVVIPESVTYNGYTYSVTAIGESAFNYCSNLTSVTIPKSVKRIDKWAFYKSNNLNKVISKIENPFTIASNVFYGVAEGAVLYVPEGTKNLYESKTGWKDHLQILEERTIRLSSSGYATFYDSQVAYSLPSGLTAQIISSVSNGRLTYKVIARGNSSDVIPKGTAVLLKGNSSSYTLIPSFNTTSYSGVNYLRGSDSSTETTGNGYHYKLSYGKSGTNLNSVFGWYWGASNGGSFLIDGHKAWLVVPSNVYVPGYSIEGDATKIESVNCDTDDDVCKYYDLQGRCINEPSKKGVYIKNGKQVIIK